MTLHYDLILGRSYSDNVVRTSVSAYTTSHAHISVYYSYAVAYLDSAIRAVSYTHLDVYKRQSMLFPFSPTATIFPPSEMRALVTPSDSRYSATLSAI